MSSYRVYHFETASEQLGWRSIFCDLADYYKKEHDAEIVYFKERFEIPYTSELYCPELDYVMQDCNFIIYDVERDIVKAITWCEANKQDKNGRSLFAALEERNNPEDLILAGHLPNMFYDPTKNKNTPSIPERFKFKVKSTTWYPTECSLSFDELYEKRQNIELIDKLFWRSSTRREDPFELAEKGICNRDHSSGHSMEEYMLEAINYKVGLAISSVGEKCYREIEYMGAGIPFLRLEFIGKHEPPLIPNYHYIAINRDEYGIVPEPMWSPTHDREGGPDYVEAYTKRFLEVKDDKEFLNFITENARTYFKENCDKLTRIPALLNLLEENENEK